MNMKQAEHGAWHLVGSLSISTLSSLHLLAHCSADPLKEDPIWEESRGDDRPRESTSSRPRHSVVQVRRASWQEDRHCQSMCLNTGLHSYVSITLPLMCFVVAFI